MRRLVSAIVLFFFAFSTLAQSRHIDTDGLTEVQRAKLYEYVAVEKEKNNKKSTDSSPSVMPDVKPEKLDMWVNAGVNLGKGLAEAAKQLGVATNEFVKTPVGMLTAGVILYKFIGKDIIKFILGSMFLTVFVCIWFYSFRRVCLMDRIEIVERIEADGKTKTKNKQVIYGNKWNNCDSGTIFVFALFALVGSAAGIGIVLS